MYDKELMMVIITASATLAGLQGVVIGQITQSKIKTQAKNWLKVALIFTFLFALLAVIVAINWLSSPAAEHKLVALFAFGLRSCQ